VIDDVNRILESSLFFKTGAKLSGSSINANVYKILKPVSISRMNWFNTDTTALTFWERAGAIGELDREESTKVPIVISVENSWNEVDILSIIKAAYTANETTITFMIGRKKSTGFGRYHITNPSTPQPDGVWEIKTSESSDLDRPYLLVEYV